MYKMFVEKLYFSILLLVVVVSNSLSFNIPLSLFFKPADRANMSAIVLIADGTEELEAVTTIDLLRRAKMRVTVAGVQGPGAVTCKYGCVLTPDVGLSVVLQQPLFDLVVIPGGEEACNFMAQSEKVGQLLTEHVKGERFIGATTSGPIVLDAHKINYLQRLTSAPEFKEKLQNHYSYCSSDVGCETIVDNPGKMITGRYSGSILEFGLALVNHVVDRKTAESVSFGLYPYTII